MIKQLLDRIKNIEDVIKDNTQATKQSSKRVIKNAQHPLLQDLPPGTGVSIKYTDDGKYMTYIARYISGDQKVLGIEKNPNFTVYPNKPRIEKENIPGNKQSEPIGTKKATLVDLQQIPEPYSNILCCGIALD